MKDTSQDSDESRKWVVVELSPQGDKETDLDAIKDSARRILRRQDVQIFIPAVSQGTKKSETHTTFYMNGYVFIEYKEDINYLKLRETSLFQDVLCTYSRTSRFGKRTPSYSLLKDRELDPMRSGMETLKKCTFSVGDKVRVTTGSFKNLPGEIISIRDDGQAVQISTDLASKPMILSFPTTYLEKV